MTSTRAYEQLSELAREEISLAEAGDLEGLERLQARRAAFIATLPPAPPEGARGALERAAVLQDQAVARIAASLLEIRAELALVGRGRRAASGYAPAATQGSVLDRAG